MVLTKLVLTKLVLTKLVLTELVLSQLVLVEPVDLVLLWSKLRLLELVLSPKVGLELLLLLWQLLDKLLPGVEELLAGLEHLLARLQQALVLGADLGSRRRHQGTVLAKLGLHKLVRVVLELVEAALSQLPPLKP